MNTNKTEITALPWVVDDGCVDMSSQARQLEANAGTDREWRAVGTVDDDGFAEVVALAHPPNAEYICRACNSFPALVEALERHQQDSECYCVNSRHEGNTQANPCGWCLGRYALALAKGQAEQKEKA